ncbi:MAG: hypothetical protein ACFFHD_11760 [Promethearchaeota archaeon]
MIGNFDYITLEELSKGKGLSQIQHIFDSLISDLRDYLKLEPIYLSMIIKLTTGNLSEEGSRSILDYGVIRDIQNEKIIIEINQTLKIYLPFILLREAYYCFIDKEASEIIKICINQIVENNLSGLSSAKDWKKLIRDSLVNSDFIHSQFDKLEKFFKIEALDPFESSIKFFFREIRESTLLSQDDNISSFYDLIFEKYSYKSSKSLFNQEIVESLRILIKLFYESKLYLNLSDYNALFSGLRQNGSLKTQLSLRKFNENMQWINKCSSIAPSYDTFNSAMGYSVIRVIIKFHPLIEKDKVKTLMEKWPFYQALQFSENGFAKDSIVTFIIPNIYLNDLINYFNRLEESGYIVRKGIYRNLKKTSAINLNYFMDQSNIKKIINPNGLNYNRKYEIETIKDYDPVSNPIPLTILDYTILDRAQNVSVTGLTFDKRIETLNAIKEDIENELRKEILINKEFKSAFNAISNSPKLKQQFLRFLDENKSQGYLFLYFQFKKILNQLDLLQKILNEQPKITNTYQFQSFLNSISVYRNIEQKLIIQDDQVKNIIFGNLVPLFFQSKNLFREELDKYQSFLNVLNACYNLKILNLKKVKGIVENPKLAEEIYQIREKRYKNFFKSVSLYKITNEKIESTIEAFLNHDPPLINPFLLNTILTSTFAKYYPELSLKNTPKTREKLEKLKFLFPRTFIFETADLIEQKNYIHVSLYLMNIKEKKLFSSLLFSLFKDSLMTMKRYFWRGVIRGISNVQPRDFYDFENKQFYYIKDLFDELFTYSQKILGRRLNWPEYPMKNIIQEFLWSKKKGINDLINAVENRISSQDFDFNLKELDSLLDFRRNLETNLVDHSKFINFKMKKYFKRYINSIQFIPRFSSFNISQYYLYFRPFYYNDINLKLLFKNSFLEIKYPASIDPNQMIYSSYIFPYRTPNTSYLNWLIKSKKIISEYCLFHGKKFYEVIQFDRNLSKAGWDYSSMRFKSYVQNVLFNPSYEPKIQNIREFDFDYIMESNFYEPNTQEFNALSQIYNRHSIDIKSYLGTKKYITINYITDLIKKKLIFPYLSLKNLDFQEKVSIILPDVKNKFNEKIIKIFSFFNMCHIYEIEGELYIYGFEDIKPFENGFLIEIWFPKCEMDEFFEVFDLIFQYFEIKHYLILTDLVDGKQLLKSVYGNLEFLDSYNPIKNLIWNDKDKIWMNHKLFNEKFEPIYPDLLYGEKKEV